MAARKRTLLILTMASAVLLLGAASYFVIPHVLEARKIKQQEIAEARRLQEEQAARDRMWEEKVEAENRRYRAAQRKKRNELEAVKAAVRERLRDPSSAKFGSWMPAKDYQVACIEVNARNSFGGYTGSKPWGLLKIDGKWIAPQPMDGFDLRRCTALMLRTFNQATASSD